MNTNIITTLGILSIVMMGALLSIYYIQKANDQLIKNSITLSGIKNESERQLNITTTYFDEVLYQQRHTLESILENVTQHEQVANKSFDNIIDTLNRTHS